MDTTRTLLADKLPDILNRTFFLLIDQEEYGTSLSSWRNYRMKQGNAKKETEGESLCRVQGLCERTEFFDSLQTNHTKPGQKPTTQMSVYHGQKSVAKSSVEANKAAPKKAQSRDKKRKFTPAYAAQSMFWPLQTIYGLDSDDYTVLADRCMTRCTKKGNSRSKTRLAGGWETASYQNHDGWLKSLQRHK